jgi:hypothetical protein
MTLAFILAKYYLWSMNTQSFPPMGAQPMRTFIIILSCALILASGCKQNKPATEDAQTNPHAGMDMSKSPHAGMDMKNNPHAGMDMNSPHSGMNGNQAQEKVPGGLDLDAMMTNLPAGWTKADPGSSMRMAQINIAAEGGDTAPAVLAVFFFPGSGGSSAANIMRWQNQYTGPKGQPGDQVAKTDTMMVGLLTVVTTDVTGTQLGSASMGGEAKDLPNQRMIASIIETPSGNWFIKTTGPAKTMSANAGKIRDFTKRAKVLEAHG